MSDQNANKTPDWNNATVTTQSFNANNTQISNASSQQVPVLLATNGVLAPQPNQPYQIVYVKEVARSLQHYPWHTSLILGALQIVCGLACITLGIFAILLGIGLSFVAAGIWGGASPIIAGALGIDMAKKKSRSKMTAHLVMCIVAAGMMTGALAVAITALIMDADCYYNWLDGCDGDSGPDETVLPTTKASRLAVDILLIFFAVTELVLAFWASGIGCKFCCCCECCWSQWFPCYNKEGSAVVDVGKQTTVMQVQGHPQMNHYQGQPGKIYHQDQPVLVQIAPQSSQAKEYENVAL